MNSTQNGQHVNFKTAVAEEDTKVKEKLIFLLV